MASTLPPTIHAVLFDYGLVLSGPPDPAAWVRLRHVLRAEESAFHDAYWRHRTDYDRGTLNGHSYWLSVGRDLHQTLDFVQVSELIEADTDLWTSPNHEMIAFAASLQRAGYKTGILSNLGDAMETGITAKFAWLEEFTHKTFSHRLNLVKPDLAIYQHAAEGLAEPASHILFLDDREENIAAARAAGMIAIQYLSHKQFVTEMEAFGLQQLLQLPSLN